MSDVKEDPILLDVCRLGNTVILSLNDERTFELAQDSVPVGLPAVGGSIDSPLLAELEAAVERKLAAREVFRLLDRRLYPRAVLSEKLVAAGFGHDIADAVLTQFETRGIHSDLQFALAYCRDTLRRGPRGRQYLRSKLRAKKIPEKFVQRALEQELPGELEADLARKAAVMRWARFGNRTVDRPALAKVIRFLMGRGFPAGLAGNVARLTAPDRTRTNEEDIR